MKNEAKQIPKPTFMRYVRVEKILESDAALRRKLGKKNREIHSRNGNLRLFSREVIQVTDHIHRQGKDAKNLPKAELLRIAGKLLSKGGGKPSSTRDEQKKPSSSAPVSNWRVTNSLNLAATTATLSPWPLRSPFNSLGKRSAPGQLSRS